MANQSNSATLARQTGRVRKGLWISIIVIIGWLSIGGISGPVFSKISNVQENDNSAFLPQSAESTLASKITVKFSEQSSDLLPTLLLAIGDVSPQSNPEAFAKLNAYAASLGDKVLPASKKALREYFIPGAPLQAIPSQDGKAALINVQLNSKIAGENIEDEPALPLIIEFIRADLEKNFGSSSIETHVTGPGGIFADLFGAFGSIDTQLLKTTLIVVALILIVVYRSPFLWVIPLFTAALALAFATMIVYYLAKANVIDLNGQTQGILDVLVLGAATDYALLLISRYREELHLHHSRFTAMRVALRGVVEPIVASGSTVIAGLMVLLLSDLSSNRGLGPVGSIGIACAMFAALTLLPSLLVLCGRWIFWPKKPRFDSEDEKLSGLWAKVGDLVDRKPKPIWISTALLLVIFAGFSFTLKSDGLAQTDAFTTRPDSVIGLEKLGEHFPSGEGTPVEIVIKESDLQPSIAAISKVANVASVVPVTNFDRATMQPTKEVKVVD
ncbi:MAG: MMPL family transporter, partial [Actinobacteria bacterium]|nr:MMPL family transporter [Actinomycetota bacterium]